MKFIFENIFKAKASKAKRNIMDLMEKGLLKSKSVVRRPPLIKPRIFGNSQFARIQRKPDQPVLTNKVKERLEERPDLIAKSTNKDLVTSESEKALKRTIQKANDHNRLMSMRSNGTFSVYNAYAIKPFEASPEIVSLISTPESDSASGSCSSCDTMIISANPLADQANDPDELDDYFEDINPISSSLEDSSAENDFNESDFVDLSISSDSATDESNGLSRSEIIVASKRGLWKAFKNLYPRDARKLLSSKQKNESTTETSSTIFRLETPSSTFLMRKDTSYSNTHSVVKSGFCVYDNQNANKNFVMSSTTTSKYKQPSGFDSCFDKPSFGTIFF